MAGEILNPHDHDRGILNEERIDALEQKTAERWENHGRIHSLEAEARTLALVELHRRLDILNHAHEEAVRVQNTYVPREVYEASQRELGERAQAVAAVVSTYLPREVFDTFVKEQATRDQRMIEMMTGIVAGGSGDRAGSQRVTTLVLALFGTFAVIGVGILGALIATR